uniref:Uncharacterized protein n=1 Tax=Anguilla anguilla TaxID=7936 RepID=A0A0E9T9N9_ANGAN
MCLLNDICAVIGRDLKTHFGCQEIVHGGSVSCLDSDLP